MPGHPSERRWRRAMLLPEPSPPATASVVTEFFCYECESSVQLPVAFAHPMVQSRPSPRCGGNFVEPGPNPFPQLDPPPTLPPGLLTISEVTDDPFEPEEHDELVNMEMLNPSDARLLIASLIQERLSGIATPMDIATATAVAMSLFDYRFPIGNMPAPSAAIALLPTVEVSDPTAVCAVCREELPLASAALKLPCSHLYHSSCVIPWLQRHNSCPTCRSHLAAPIANIVEASQSEQDPQITRITIRFNTNARPRARVYDGVIAAEAPVSESPTQLAQAGTGEGGGALANTGETVSSESPSPPESGAVKSEPRDGDGFSD